MLYIAKFDRYDMVNNPGDPTASMTIWFTGCDFRCKNCYNRKLWDKEFGKKYHTELVAKIVVATCNKLNLKSVVLLGGEPLQQDKEELLLLCRFLKKHGLKIWLYTGYEFQEVYSMHRSILEHIDVIKCGKYIDELKQDGFPASSNQMIYERSVAGGYRNITSNIRRI